MEDPPQQPEEELQPLLHPAAGGIHAWLEAVPIKCILLSVLSVLILCAIGLLSAGSLDYKVWIQTVVSMDAKHRQSALFSLAGDATTLFLIYAPMDTFIDIWREGTVGGRTHVANVASIVNSCIWTWYGLVLTTVNYSVSIVNFTGALFHLGYLVVFFTYCERRVFFFTWVGIGVAFGMGVAAVDVCLKFAGHELASVVGCSGALTGVTMYLMSSIDNMVVAHRTNGNEGKAMLLAPFLNATLWTVYTRIINDNLMLVVAHRTNGNEGKAMLLPTFLNATLWTVYARIINDNLMLFPNATGVILSVCQVLQRCVYYFFMLAGELQAWIVDIWNAMFRDHGGGLIDPNNNNPGDPEE